MITRQPPRDDLLVPGVPLSPVGQQLDQRRLMRDGDANLLGMSLEI